MSFKKALIWVICFQMIFGNSAYAYDGDDGPDYDFSDEPFVVTPGEDRHEGRNDGNCTGSGCGERAGRGDRGDDRDDETSDRGGYGERGRDDSRGDRTEYDEIDWQPYGEPAMSNRNFKVVVRSISTKDYKGAAGMISVKDAQGALYFRGKASRVFHREDGEYYTPDNRDIYFDRKGVPYVKSIDGKHLLNVDGIMECGPADSCAASGYREDWWNYSMWPYVDNSADAQAWTEVVDFQKNNYKIKKGIAASRAKASERGSTNERILNEVEFLASEAKVAFQRGSIYNADALQEGALQLLEVIADIGISLSPAGWAKDAYELVSGRSFIDGHVLNSTERVFAGIGAMSPAFGPLGYAGMRMISRTGRVASETAFFSKLGKLNEKVVVATHVGPAEQEFTKAALEVKAMILNQDANIFRIGTRGRSMTGKQAQFWALEHPKSPGYGGKYGIPQGNFAEADFIEVGKIKAGTPFVTREAPKFGNSRGGAIEIVVPEGAVILQGHYSL